MNPSTTRGPQDPILRLSSIAKSFCAAVALDNVDVQFEAGTVTALTGENGSGKSTIAKILGGMISADSGEISVRGETKRIPNAKIARSYGIALISQELTLADELTVAENIFMGRLPRSFGVVSWKSVYAEASRILTTYGMSIDPRARVGSLPLETKQEVEIARALATEPDVLILDEATSSLSEAAAERLLRLVELRREMGTAVIMITHRMNEIYRVADRAAVLRDGRIVASVPIPSTDEDELVRLMVGRELGDYYDVRRHDIDASRVLAVRGLTVPSENLGPVDIDVHRGEIVGIAGLSGSGKETLGHALGGAVAAEGSVDVSGRPVELGRPDRILKGGLGFVPEDRKAMALLLDRSVSDNLALAWSSTIFTRGFRRRGRERTFVDDAMQRYDIRASSPQLPVRSLSGGNQQKITIGRLFELELPVYVMSEPTRGIDVGAKSAIYTLLRGQAAKGAGVLFISSELNELCGVCDRVLAMYQGRIVAELTGDDINEEAINHATVTGQTVRSAA
jgi:ABC-type sugar transport system ATPase subunit